MQSMRHKVVTASATKGVRAGTNVFTISTGELDRDGDRIAPDGWNLGPYRENPIVLWGHERTSLPIGKCIDIRLVNGKLTGTIEWPPTGLYPFADTVRAMVEKGYLRSASVGFIAQDSRPNQHGGYDHTAPTLIEWSIVNLPSNPSATLQRSAPTMLFKSWLGGAWRPESDRSESIITIIDTPIHTKEDRTMRNNEVILTLKDNSAAPDNMPNVNWPEIRRRLAAAAREVDATCAQLGVQSSIEQQVNDAVNQAMNPSKAVNPYRAAWDASQEKFHDEERGRKWGREVAAANATPLNKRFTPGYAKVY